MIFAVIAQAQVNRYMVFFSDKNETVYDIAAPLAFLSQRSVDRRLRYNIPVTEQDLPVNDRYIEEIEGKGAATFFSTRWMNGVLVQMDDSLVAVMEALPEVRKVEFVAPGAKLQPFSMRIAEKYSGINARTSEISNALQNNMLGVDVMHEEGYTGKDIMIAILDAGFLGADISPYLERIYDQHLIVATRDFVENGADVYRYDDHGTGVLSTISGFLQGTYEGIAYDANLVLCITEDTQPEDRIEEYNWLFAAEFADSIGVDIINTSLGYNTFDDPAMNYTYADMDGNTTVITRAADLAASKGILCVNSIGNEGNNSWGKLVAPADADSAISVGAVNPSFTYLSFSSTGPTADNRLKPDVSALGQGTSIVSYDGQLSHGNGTSFASPLIAGLAAGIWQAYPDLNNVEMIDLIKRGSSQYDHPDTLIGYGVPDFKKIITEITTLDENIIENSFNIYPNPVESHKLFVEFLQEIPGNPVLIHIYNTQGKNVFEYTQNQLSHVLKLELDLTGLKAGVYIMKLGYGHIHGSVKLLVP